MPGGGERRRERIGEAVSWGPKVREGPTEDELGKDPWDLGRRQWLVTW